MLTFPALPLPYGAARRLCFGTLALLLCSPALADGMVPRSSVLIVEEHNGEATMEVTNTDPKVSLLYTRIENLPEDPEPLLTVTPPLARVEPSKSQLVRFILQSPKPLTTQRLKRVIFEGMPQGRSEAEAGHARVGVTVRQNLPVILHPKGLAPNRTPWTGLAWRLKDSQLSVHNPTPYVVRMAQELRLLPGNVGALLPRTYVLPGETLTVAADAPGATHVSMQPATVYGYATDIHKAPLTL